MDDEAQGVRGWGAAIVLLAAATFAPVMVAAAAFVWTEGWARLGIALLGLFGLLMVLPFWPPILRRDHAAVSQMIQRRSNGRGL